MGGLELVLRAATAFTSDKDSSHAIPTWLRLCRPKWDCARWRLNTLSENWATRPEDQTRRMIIDQFAPPRACSCSDQDRERHHLLDHEELAHDIWIRRFRPFWAACRTSFLWLGSRGFGRQS